MSLLARQQEPAQKCPFPTWLRWTGMPVRGQQLSSRKQASHKRGRKFICPSLRIEWAISISSICERDHPYCRTPSPDNALPERYAHLVGGDNGGTCPFRAECPSADLAVRYLEHSFDADWY
jgi:hypothetical protein